MKRHKWNLDREESVDSLALEPNSELLTPVIIYFFIIYFQVNLYYLIFDRLEEIVLVFEF